MAYLLEKDKSTSDEIVRLFEKVRVAYLSARTDPKEYGAKWRSVIDGITEKAAGSEILIISIEAQPFASVIVTV